MEPHSNPDHVENREGDEHCDGCDRLYRASDLSPIGDGLIKVCRECYSAATALVSAMRRPAIPEPEPASPRPFSPTGRPAASPYQNPQLALPRFSGTSAGSGPPAETKSFAHGS